MEKMLIVLCCFFLFGCVSQNVEQNKTESSETAGIDDSEQDRSLLPVNVEDVIDEYESLLPPQTDTKVNADNTYISMEDGSLVEVQTLLEVINNHLGNGEETDGIVVEVLDGLKMDEHFTGDYIIDGINIQIAADEPSYIGVMITKDN